MTGEKKPSKGMELLLGLLAVIFTCLYPCVFLFSVNAGEARAVDILPFFLLFLVTALIGLAILSLILRSLSRGAVMTCLGMLVVVPVQGIALEQGHADVDDAAEGAGGDDADELRAVAPEKREYPLDAEKGALFHGHASSWISQIL